MVICADDPMATPREMFVLFFSANMTAAACSAALPTIGRRMVETNGRGTFQDLAAPAVRGGRGAVHGRGVRGGAQHPQSARGFTLDCVHDVVREDGHEDSEDSEPENAPPVAEHGLLLVVAVRLLVTVVLCMGLALLKQELMRVQLEQEIRPVHQQEEARYVPGETDRVHRPVQLGVRRMEHVGQGQAQDPKQEQAAGSKDAFFMELLALVPEPPEEERAAEHKQHIAQDAAKQRQLDHSEHILSERVDRDDHLCYVSEGGIQQPADGCVGVHGELLRAVAEALGERAEPQECQRESPSVAPFRDTRHDGKGNAQQKQVELRAEKDSL